MFEDDGFVYKRLSVGKEPFGGPGRGGPSGKTAEKGLFFNFKFVNRGDGASFAREKGQGTGKRDNVPEKSTREALPAVLGEAKRPRNAPPPKIVKFSAPATRDPRQLHRLLNAGDGIDALARLAVDFLRHKLRFPPFLDRLNVRIDVPEHDLEKQIEEIDTEVGEIDGEMRKWGDVLGRTMDASLVEMDFAFQDGRVDEIRARKKRVAEVRTAFAAKEAVLVSAVRGLERAVVDVQGHCESLFRKILRTAGRSGYDSAVVLRAISRLGR